jgi:hypothetical protein
MWLLLPLFLCSCSVTQKVQNDEMLESGPLSTNQKVYIALPNNGQFNNIVYGNSAAITQHALKDALGKYNTKIALADEHTTPKSAIAEASAANAKYLFYPTIQHWEDRNTPLSGISDKITIEIKVFERGKNEAVVLSTLSAASPYGAVVNNPPEVMLPKLFGEYVDKIYK